MGRLTRFVPPGASFAVLLTLLFGARSFGGPITADYVLVPPIAVVPVSTIGLTGGTVLQPDPPLGALPLSDLSVTLGMTTAAGDIPATFLDTLILSDPTTGESAVFSIANPGRVVLDASLLRGTITAPIQLPAGNNGFSDPDSFAALMPFERGGTITIDFSGIQILMIAFGQNAAIWPVPPGETPGIRVTLTPADSVPEPGTLAVTLAGLLVLGGARCFRRRRVEA